MPIDPPSFNVPAISPASIAAIRREQRQSRDGPLEGFLGDIVKSVLGYQLQSKLVEEREKGRLETMTELEGIRERGRIARAFAGDVAEGDLMQVGTVGPGGQTQFREDVHLPGDLPLQRAPESSGLQGIFAPREAVERAQPVENLFGRPTREGLTRGDLLTPEGGQRSTEELKGEALAEPGERQALLKQLRGMRQQLQQRGIGGANVERLSAVIQEIEQDPEFTLGEYQEARSEYGVETAGNMDEMLRRERDLDRETQREVVKERARLLGNTAVEAQSDEVKSRGFEVVVDLEGQERFVRDLTFDEATLLAQGRLDPRALTEGERTRYEQLEKFIEPNVRTPEGVVMEVRRMASAAGNPSNPVALQNFSAYIQNAIRNPDGSMNPDHDLAERIINSPAGGGLAPTQIRSWAQSDDAAMFRNAYALDLGKGFGTPEEINRLQSDGLRFDFGYDGIRQAFRTLKGAEWDAGVAAPKTTDDQTTGGGAGGGESPELPEAGPEVTGARETLTPMVQNADESTQVWLARTFTSDRSEALDSLRTVAERNREAARRSDLSAEQRESFRQTADFFESLAATGDTASARYENFRDSVMIPLLRVHGTGRVKALLNDSSR